MAVISHTVVAGALWRGRIRRDIKQFCWGHDFELEIDEDKGLFESVLRFQITVPDGHATYAQDALVRYFRRVATED